MLLTVHILAGSTFALALVNPYYTTLLCFATHLVLDAIPHWNYPVPKARNLKTFYQAFGPDLIMTISVFLALLVVFRDRWYLVIWGTFWSALPDYLTLYKKEKPFKTLLKPYYNFHDKVQFEVNKGPGIAFQGFTVVILVLILLGLAN